MSFAPSNQLNTNSRDERPAPRGYITETDVDWSLKPFFVLLILGAVVSVLVSFLLRDFNTYPAGSTLFIASLGMFALLVLITFQSLLLKSLQLFLWVTLVEAAGLLTFFYNQISPWFVFGAVLFILHLVSGFLRGRTDLTDHLTIHFGRFSRIVVVSAVSGLAMYLALFYAGMYRANGVSFETFRFVTAGSQPIIARFVPGYDGGMGANQFFQEFARGQLRNHPQVVLLSPQDQEEVISQTGFQLRNQVVSATKIPVGSNETFMEYTYRVSTSYLTTIAEGGLSLLPIVIIILVVYSLIRGVMFFLRWPVIWASYVLYRVLLGVKMIYITVEPRSKEILMMK